MNKSVLILGGCGYLGSALYKYLGAHGVTATTVDLEWFGNVVNPANIRADVGQLDATFLSQYSTVINLAGHSGPSMCRNDARSSFQNNVANFVALLGRLSGQKLIYASSAAVYGATDRHPAVEEALLGPAASHYELSKRTIDGFARLWPGNHIALRMGPVCGYSPNLRSDTIINRMVMSARATGKVEVFQSSAWRPVLGISDFCRAVHTILERDGPVGVYNLASFDLTAGDIGRKVASIMGAAVVDRNAATTSSYRASTDKFVASWDFQFSDSVETIVASLVESVPSCVHERAPRRYP